MAVVYLHVLSDRGNGILDELERRTGGFPYLTSPKRREYYVEEDVSVFDPVLAEINPDWAAHLRRSPDG